MRDVLSGNRGPINNKKNMFPSNRTNTSTTRKTDTIYKWMIDTAGWWQGCRIDICMYCMIMVYEGECYDHGVTVEGFLRVCDWWFKWLLQKWHVSMSMCKPVLSLHQAYMYKKRAFPNPSASSHISIIPNSLLPSAASLICRWRASAPLSTSASCCLWCRPLEGALWMAGCGCHSLLGRRDRWTRCVGRCGFRRHRPLWFCGKRGCRNSCSWCSYVASCAKPGTRRCRAIRWPLWQG